jgi:hypothetical protein
MHCCARRLVFLNLLPAAPKNCRAGRHAVPQARRAGWQSHTNKQRHTYIRCEHTLAFREPRPTKIWVIEHAGFGSARGLGLRTRQRQHTQIRCDRAVGLSGASPHQKSGTVEHAGRLSPSNLRIYSPAASFLSLLPKLTLAAELILSIKRMPFR